MQLFVRLLISDPVCQDQLSDGLNANPDSTGGILSHGHEHTGFLPLLVPDSVEA